MDFVSSVIIGIGGYYLISFLFDKNNHEALNIDKDYKSSIIITKISHNDNDVKKYVKKWLEFMYLNENLQIQSKNHIPIVPEKIFNNKIYLEYKLNNNYYALCINKEIKKIDKIDKIDKNIKKSKINKINKINKKILMGHLISKERNEKISVKEILTKFQGPMFDFYKNLEGVSKKLEDILHLYNLDEWDSLVILDLFGEKITIDLKNNDEI